MKLLLIIIFFNLFFYSCSAQNQKDTASLNDLANQEINKYIKSLPPIINMSFYLDGKLVKKGYIVYLLVNGICKEQMKNRKIFIDTVNLKEGDTLSFLISYQQKTIYSNKFSYKRFLHGGEIIAGIVSDYENEKEKFILDNSSYFVDNQTNKLYEILIRTSKMDANFIGKKYQLEYNVVISHINSLTSFKYEFIP